VGLFLAKGIVELHGGMIKIESEGRNKGSIISISIPMHFSLEKGDKKKQESGENAN
jgi:signal transduction histidine kinase